MTSQSTLPRNAVRPGERTPKKRLAAALASIRRLVGGDRFENLYGAIRVELMALTPPATALLDYGCGSMEFSRRLRSEGVIMHFLAVDLYPAPTGVNTVGDWQHYLQIRDGKLPKLTARFDAAIVIDVLHHADENQLASILNGIGRAAQSVIVKDHFEYGAFSRQLLRLADWFGNFAFGVQIPRRYFTPQRWEQLVTDAGMREIKRIRNVRVHDGLFGVLLAPRHHFIAVLERADHGTA